MQLANKAKSLNGVPSSCPVWTIEDQAHLNYMLQPMYPYEENTI